MRYLKYSISVILLLALIISMLPSSAEADVVTFAVDGDGVNTGGGYGGLPADWSGMNLDDDDVSYWTQPSYTYKTWSFAPITSNDINSVTLYWKVRSTHADWMTWPYTQSVCVVSGTPIYGVETSYKASGLNYVTFSTTYATNPLTGLPWTSASLNAATFGCKSRVVEGGMGGGTYDSLVTYVYLSVDYNTLPPSVTTIAADAISYGGGTQNTTINGEITSIGSASLDLRGFAWSTASNSTAPGNMAPPASYSSNFTEGATGTGIFNCNTGSLSPATSYYFRAYAHNSFGWGWGDEMTFTSLSGPIITTLPATNVSQNSARFNAVVNNDGGSSCTVRFLRGTASGVYTSNTTVIVPTTTYVMGNTPYLDVAGLLSNQTYYVRAEIVGEVSTVLGSEVSFTTSSSINPPSVLSGIPTSNTISLAWVKGTGSDQTAIRYSLGVYPSSNTTGTLGYLGTDSSTVITGLTPGTTYYFMAWGAVSGTYSTSNITQMVTTLAGSASPTTMPTPATPTGWFQAPDYTNMEHTPMYSIVNFAADAFAVPRGTMWYMCALFFCVAVGVFFYSTVGNANLFLSVCAVGAMMIACSLMKLVPYWQILPFAVFAAVGIFVGERR